MPILKRKVFKKLVSIIEPHCYTSAQRRQLVYELFIGQSVEPPDIDYEGASLDVTERIIQSLIAFGKLDDKQAIWRFLTDVIYERVGVDQQRVIDSLEIDLDVYILYWHGDDLSLQLYYAKIRLIGYFSLKTSIAHGLKVFCKMLCKMRVSAFRLKQPQIV